MQLFQISQDTTENVAAVDLGSNSFHMIVARIENGQLQVIDKLREMVRLGAGLNDDKTLKKKTAERAIACLERFGQRLRDFPRGSVRAVGTNTLRQVRDPDFLDLAQQALGHPIDIIAGREEARLVYLGVANGLDTGDKKRLVVDIGGGSTELIIGQKFDIFSRESLHMGCVSYSNRYFPDGIINKENMSKAVLAGRLDIRPVKQTFNAKQWDLAVGSSGTIKAIRTVVQAMGWSSKGISRSSLKKLRKIMIEQGSFDALDIEGLSSERKPVFAGGVAVLSAVFKSLDIEVMQVSDEALREGLLYEMVGLFHHEDIREKTIRTFQERYNIDKTQSRRVQTTVLQLLEQIKEDWQLQDPEWTGLLRWSSALHEIGLAISHSQFQKHGAYILENADLSGFSRQQQRFLSTLVRTHRRKLQEPLFENLHADSIEGIKRLTIILRLAVLMHRGRNSASKPRLTLKAANNKLEAIFPEDWLEEHPLTVVEMEREAKQLRNIGYELTVS